MTFSIQATQSAPQQPVQEMNEKSSLFDLKNSGKFEEFISGDKERTDRINKAFESVAVFFQRINEAHDDALKCISLEETLHSSKASSYLASEYAKLNDKDFVKCNAIDQNAYYLHKFIAKRLDSIQEHRQKMLIFPFVNPNWAPLCLFKREMSLKEVRNLTTDNQKKMIGMKEHFHVSLFSTEQKRAVRDPMLFQELLLFDSKENKAKYMPLMPASDLTHMISSVESWAASELPYTVIPKIAIDALSQRRFYDIMKDNVAHLDKMDISETGLQKILRRLISQALETVSAEIPITDDNGKERTIHKDVSWFPPKIISEMPDSIFQKINLTELNSDELYILFHPHTIESKEKFGSVMKNDGRHVKEIQYIHHLTKEKNSCLAKISYYGIDTRGFEKYTQEREVLNKRRLALIGKEQYEAIRSKLDPSIQILGDKVYSPS